MNSVKQPASMPEERPAASAELVLIRSGAQALIRTLGKRKGDRFLREWSALLLNIETVEVLMPTRPASERVAVVQAQREALAWWRQMLPLLLDTIPPE